MSLSYKKEYNLWVLPVVDGCAEDAEAGAQDGAQYGPVLGLLCLSTLLLVRVPHSVGQRAEALALTLLVELVLLHQMPFVLPSQEEIDWVMTLVISLPLAFDKAAKYQFIWKDKKNATVVHYQFWFD